VAYLYDRSLSFLFARGKKEVIRVWVFWMLLVLLVLLWLDEQKELRLFGEQQQLHVPQEKD